MGPKGLNTRSRLVDAAVLLLGMVRLADLRVADIARAAGTSSATFYHYFADAPDVVLEAIKELSQSTPDILRLLSEDWLDGNADLRARALVGTYIDFWAAHATLFRARNLAAEEGDGRFRSAREQSIQPMLEMLTTQITRTQAAGHLPASLHPGAMAGVLIAMLERIATVVPIYAHDSGLTPSRMTEAAAHMFATTLGLVCTHNVHLQPGTDDLL